jgi:hypothetical protein
VVASWGGELVSAPLLQSTFVGGECPAAPLSSPPQGVSNENLFAFLLLDFRRCLF